MLGGSLEESGPSVGIACFITQRVSPFKHVRDSQLEPISRWTSSHPRSTKEQMCKAVPSPFLPMMTRDKWLAGPSPSQGPSVLYQQILHLKALCWSHLLQEAFSDCFTHGVLINA